MKVSLGMIVTELHGSCGGHTIQRTGSGYIMKPKTDPTRTPTTRQLIARQRVLAVSKRWRELTTQQRKKWLGTVYDEKTGFNLFKQFNLNRLFAGSAISNNVPVFVVPQARSISAVTADASASTLVVSFSPNIIAGEFVIGMCTPPKSQGVSNPRRTFIRLTSTSTPGAFQFNLGGAFITRFGSFKAGQVLFVKLLTIYAPSGTKSQSDIVRVTVVP